MTEETTSMNEVIEEAAEAAHEANRDYCKSIGDDSQPAWDKAPDWQKESVRDGVRFHLMHQQAGPEASHHNWLAYKRRKGWVYGKKKDGNKKTHPNFMLYEELPEEQKKKDALFYTTVQGVLRKHGLLDE